MWIGVISRGLFSIVITNVYGSASVWLNLVWKHFGRAFSHCLKFSCLKTPLDLGVKGYLQYRDLTSHFVSSPCSALCCSSFTVTSASPLQTCRTSNRMAVSGQSTWKVQDRWFLLQFGRVFQHKFSPDKVTLLDKRKMWPNPLVTSTDSDGLVVRTRCLYNRGCHTLDFLSKILDFFFFSIQFLENWYLLKLWHSVLEEH